MRHMLSEQVVRWRSIELLYLFVHSHRVIQTPPIHSLSIIFILTNPRQFPHSTLHIYPNSHIISMDKGQQELQLQLQNLTLDAPQASSSSEQQQKWEKIEEPERQMPLFMVDFEQCDSKKCTGKKMERFKLLSSIRDRKKKFRGIVLSAFGKKFVSRNDLECAEKYGICVIDCSWNRIEETKEFRYKHERKLPFVVAGNPVNFGKPYQLSCVEALATALCAMDYVPQAKFIMSKFGWSDGFWKQNPNIAAYGNCQTLQQMATQSQQNEAVKNQGFERNYDLPQDEDSDSAE